MLDIKLNCNEKLFNSLKLLEKKLNIKLNNKGIEITAYKSDKLHIECKDNIGIIEYITESSFFRMVTLFIKEYKKGNEFSYDEKISIDVCGPMLDMSRNAVLKVEKVKDYIDYCAMMGLNQFVLYIEDIYEIDGYPYFGYMRGRYTKEELKEIDDYACNFGIEVVINIQTLAHLERYLHWDESYPVRDTFTCLMADNDETYKFIDKIFETISESIRSKYILIGMDEASGLGSGNYYRKNGLKEPIDILKSHLEKVSSIAKKYGYSCGVFSDMFFKLLSKDESNYQETDYDIEDVAKDLIPDNVSLICWAYDLEKEEEYNKYMASNKKLSDKVEFMGGIHTWHGYLCDTYTTYINMGNALKAALNNNINRVFASVWEDDGGECNHFASLCGLQLFAEYMYGSTDTLKTSKENFEFILGASFDAFMDMSQFHNIFDGRVYEFCWFKYYGKKYLYQDILSGVADNKLDTNPMSEHYIKYAHKMNSYIKEENIWNEYYAYAKDLFFLSSLKCEIAEKLRDAYKLKDVKTLCEIANVKLPLLTEKINAFKEKSLKIWYEFNKPSGAEVLDIRLAGIVSRCETASKRINDYLNNKIEKIEELEYERMPFASYNGSSYRYISTVNIM